MLTIDEIELLIEGIDAWVAKPAHDMFIKGIFAVSMSRSQQDSEERINNLYKEEKLKEKEDKLRQDRATLLKAKLIMLKDKVVVEETVADQITDRS